MPAELIISISGMRGIVGQNLTAPVAAEYGCAFGCFLARRRSQTAEQRPRVCIGRDSRPSGPMLASAVAAGLCAAGVDVIDLGVVTTPSVGIMVRELGCAGGVVITASHNPDEYNGIKLLLDTGMAPRRELAEQIRSDYLQRRFSPVGSLQCGSIRSEQRTDETHIARVLGIVDKEAIAARGFSVVLDSVNGAGGRAGAKLLAELGCRVRALNAEPTGLFAHSPEPVAENLGSLCDAVRSEGADVGFAQDPDADRLAIVDEGGTFIGEEFTLALAARLVFSHGTGSAATNLSTSRMIDDIAEAAGGEVFRTPVGEANVAAAMLEHDCIIGGEGNGGVIDLRVGPIRDSLVAMAMVLQLMTETGKSVSALAAEVGGYYMVKEKFTAEPAQALRIFDAAKRSFSGAKLETSDGCRFDFPDGWLHIRCSNTEPVMRVIVEARSEETARRYLDAVARIRARVLT